MPRISAEARSAAVFRAGAEPVGPPAHLCRAAAAIWREIVASKPADWFDVGARPVLASYCTISARIADLTVKLEKARKRGAQEEQRSLDGRLAMFGNTQ